MSSALSVPNRILTRDEYLKWYSVQPGRFERLDGRVVAMSPERVVHVRTKQAAFMALARAIASAQIACEALPDGIAVRAGDSDFEPDALVNCGPRLEDDATEASNPVIVVEVLSPGMSSVDTGAKLLGYFAVPSIAHYLVIHPIKRIVTHHRRADGRIETRLVSSGTLAMDPPGLTIAVADLYPATAAPAR